LGGFSRRKSGPDVVRTRPGSPAEKAGLKPGDIIDLIDGMEVESRAAFEAAVDAKRPGAEVRLRLLSGGRERRITATLAQAPKLGAGTAREVPHLMLDTGGHMAQVRDIAFTPDGKYVVSAGDDKVIRLWDWQAGKTVRTLRGQTDQGNEGKLMAMALSPDGRWLAAGGWMDTSSASTPCCGDIRLYDFATGEVVALLKGHTSTVIGLAFSRDSKFISSLLLDGTARRSTMPRPRSS
jgi:WD40 repeat protein